MAKGWRSTLLFVAGSLAGGAIVLAVYLGYFAPQLPKATVYSQQTMPMPTVPSQPAEAAVAMAAAVVPGTCPSQPIAQATAEGDGLFQLDTALAVRPQPEPSALLSVAREAAEAGRLRDAEVAYIAACHVTEQASGAQSAPLADVKTQLGQHYVTVAGRESTEATREALLDRASRLFSQGATAYAAALGKNASKTRMAEQRLASLRDPSLRLPEPAAPAEPVVVSAPTPAREAAPETARLGSARQSLAERPPLRSEDLGQVDSDLERLYAQARAVSRDPAGVQRRHQQALAQRQACRGDADCLRSWAAQRKRQLFEEF